MLQAPHIEHLPVLGWHYLVLALSLSLLLLSLLLVVVVVLVSLVLKAHIMPRHLVALFGGTACLNTTSLMRPYVCSTALFSNTANQFAATFTTF